MCCRDCRLYGENYLGNAYKDRSFCCFTPPASLTKALGLSSPYEIEFAPVDPSWSCDLFELLNH